MDATASNQTEAASAARTTGTAADALAPAVTNDAGGATGAAAATGAGASATNDAAGAVGAAATAASKLPFIPVPEIAVITSQADLQRVLAEHLQWTQAVLDPNIEVAVGRANLEGVDLRGYSLAGANLSGANLSGANLAEVDLEGANLTVANLEGAVLACANLRHAKLRRARIAGADLRGADLTGAILTGVDLSKATVKTPEPAPPSRGASANTGDLAAADFVPGDGDGDLTHPATVATLPDFAPSLPAGSDVGL